MWPWPLTDDLEIKQLVPEVDEVHVRAKFHQTECSGSWVIVLTNFFALSRNGKKIRKCNPVTFTFDPWHWNSLVFVRLSRNMFVQNFIELSAAVRQLSCVERERKNSDANITVHRYRADSKNLLHFRKYKILPRDYFVLAHAERWNSNGSEGNNCKLGDGDAGTLRCVYSTTVHLWSVRQSTV